MFASETQMSNEDTETPRLASIMNDGACAGCAITPAGRGVEQLEKDENSLGVSPDAISAATAVLHPITRKSAGVSSYSRGSHFELQLPSNRLRCGCCGRQV